MCCSWDGGGVPTHRSGSLVRRAVPHQAGREQQGVDGRAGWAMRPSPSKADEGQCPVCRGFPMPAGAVGWGPKPRCPPHAATLPPPPLPPSPAWRRSWPKRRSCDQAPASIGSAWSERQEQSCCGTAPRTSASAWRACRHGPCQARGRVGKQGERVGGQSSPDGARLGRDDCRAGPPAAGRGPSTAAARRTGMGRAAGCAGRGP